MSKKEIFNLSGPVYLTTVDWTNPCHQRSVAATLVRSVHVLERDRQKKRHGSQALAPPWWKAFKFELYKPLFDDDDSSIFGAIFHLPPAEYSQAQAPRYVVAFRGTIAKIFGPTFARDAKLDLRILLNTLHRTSRPEAAIEAVRHAHVAASGSRVWIAGHSLGAAIALLAGKKMARGGVPLDTFLFNSPFLSAPIERMIKSQRVKRSLRIAGSAVTAGLALAVKARGTFADAPPWLPHLFVNPADYLCAEYVAYFEHRRWMEDAGGGEMGRLAAQHTMGGLVLNAVLGREAEEPLHLIPSAHVTVNRSPARGWKEAHGIYQWWRPDLHLETKTYTYDI